MKKPLLPLLPLLLPHSLLPLLPPHFSLPSPPLNNATHSLRSALRWGDAVMIVLGITLILVLMTSTGAGRPVPDDDPHATRYLVIRQAGQEPQRHALTEWQQLAIPGRAGVTQVEMAPGRARCLHSPGAQGICEAAGWLERPGDMAVSLPNRLTLQIEGSRPGPFDSVHF